MKPTKRDSTRINFSSCLLCVLDSTELVAGRVFAVNPFFVAS